MNDIEKPAHNSTDRPRLAGGIFLLIGPIVGVIGGLFARQPSLGMVAGLGGGAVLATIVWLADRKRG